MAEVFLHFCTGKKFGSGMHFLNQNPCCSLYSHQFPESRSYLFCTIYI